MVRTTISNKQLGADVVTGNEITRSTVNGNISIEGKDIAVYVEPDRGSAVYDTTGTYQLTIPADVYEIYVDYLIGAGGGGGGATSGTKIGGNGGMGQIRYNKTLSVVPGQVITITIGAGGLGGAAGKAGGAGGASSIGALLTANGGALGPYWNTSAGSPGADGGPNESPHIKTAFKNGLYGAGRTGSSGSGTAGTPGFCSIRW